MPVLVVYESMYGNTHTVAEAIGRGVAETVAGVDVVAVAECDPTLVGAADLLVVGGPTHVHGMASGRTRAAAVEAAADDDELHLEPHADGPGLKDWFERLDDGAGRMAAAFDTRVDKPVIITGRASKAIARRLRHHGFRVVGEPTSFVLGDGGHLPPGQETAALEWGRELAGLLGGGD